LVSELQVRGVGAVIACRAPVQDWFMPAFSSLYWYFRLDDLIPADALLRAKRVFESRSWPETLRDDLRTAYAAQMDHILLQARYRPEGVETDDAAERSRSLMASIAGWALPSAVRSHYFGDDPAQRQRLTPVLHEQFSKSFCERSTRRKLLINGCLDALLSGAKVQTDAATQAFIQQAIAHLCAMTVCFGGAQHPLRASRMPSSHA
jgi:hypothetical protein